MPDPLIVEAVRGEIVESVHVVDAVVVGDDGSILRSAGDPEIFAAFRSSAKPLQAAVCLEAGWEPPAQESLAVACASHNGEPPHVEAMLGTLAAAGIAEDLLRTPPALPFERAAAAAATAEMPRYHNCSGKHAAMLAACAAAGWPLEGYRDAAHPLQAAIADRMREVLGIEPATATDGCGVVTFAAPLRALAAGFAASLRSPAGRRAAEAMQAHPFLVAGTERADTALLELGGGLVVKAGAEGLSCAAFPGGAVAVKVRDGSPRAVPPALVAVLVAAGAIEGPGPERLARPPVLGGGRPAGVLRLSGAVA